ncbi:MAG: RNA 3'-terminal phosphate cyclase [Dehalococcoidia bacterium]
MIEIDGGQKSGSGTIVRSGLALAALLGEPLHLYNIRAKRPKPGLRAQHLTVARAIAELTGASLEGATLGSGEIWFRPAKAARGGSYSWDIGSAGSTTMLAQTLIPLACFADRPCTFRLKGGLFQDFAPSAYHMQRVLLPTLARMGVQAELRIVRPGYVPKDAGVIEVGVRPLQGKIGSLSLPIRRGPVQRIWGVALCSHLQQRRVSERMATRCAQVLEHHHYRVGFEHLYDTTAVQAGAALAVFAETEDGCLLGSDQAGAPRRTSEAIGEYVARVLLEDLDSGASVDRYLADQLVLYAALAEGVSQYSVPAVTDHLETNLWLAETILGTRAEISGHSVRIEGVGFALPR